MQGDPGTEEGCHEAALEGIMTKSQAFRLVCTVEDLIDFTLRGETGPARLNCVETLAEFVYRLANGLPIDDDADIPPADGAGC